jgi:hypothetical protein
MPVPNSTTTSTRGLPTEGQAFIHLASVRLRGVVVRADGRQAARLRPVRDWLGEPPVRSRAARRARPPVPARTTGADRDLAKWAGLPLRDAAPARGDLSEIEEGRMGRSAGVRGAARDPSPRLLGAFDPACRLVLTGGDRRPHGPGSHRHFPALRDGRWRAVAAEMGGASRSPAEGISGRRSSARRGCRPLPRG